MIDISLKGHSLVVALDPFHKQYQKARIIVRSLLTSSEFDDNKFYVGYDDLGFLRNKLDMAGLVDDRLMDEDAVKWISWLHSVHVRNEDIKKGVRNEHVKKLLEGKLKTTPYEDQVSAVSLIMNNRRIGVFDTMGFGKSLQGLAATVALGSEVAKTLVICPLSVIIGWVRETGKHTHLKALPIPSGRKIAPEFVRDNKDGAWDIMLVHPENLVAAGKTSKALSDVTQLLKAMTWDQIIVDEFHMYKNWSAKRTQCVVSLINESKDRNGKSPRVVLMTGTPVSENPTSAYVALKLLSGGSMPHISRFENHFCVKKGEEIWVRSKITGKPEKRIIQKLVGFKNLGELKSMIDRVSIRRTKDDAVGFPEQTSVIRDILLSGKQHKLYRALCGEMSKELPSKSLVNIYTLLGTNTTALRIRQLMNHPSLIGEEGDSAKYVELDYILEELLSDPEQKVVIWTEWRAAVDLLYTRYNKLYGAAKIYGGVNNEQLDQIRDKFENQDRSRVIVSIPAKGGTGLDFLARARTAIYVDRPMSYILYNQSLDRICRRIAAEGNLSELDRIRSKPATLMFLDVVHSLDEMIRDKLWGKVNFVDSVTIKDEKLIELGKQDLLRYLK